jgi:phosphate starvation-inducible PhoH-like protein
MTKRRRKELAAAKNAAGERSEPTAPQRDKSPLVHQRDKIKTEVAIKVRDDLTERQKQFIDLVMDKKTRLVFVDGPAGTTKTYLAVLCGLMLLNKRAVSDILYVRSVAESASKSLGYLPGDANEKFQPFLSPCVEKLEELLHAEDVARLMKEKRVDAVPVNFLRGASFNARFILADESQNFTAKELTTLVTRLGEFSKMLVIGDHLQSDINGASGLMKFYDLFNDESSREHGIHCFSFTKADIKRSGILGYIVDRLEGNSGTARAEPMFPPA